MFIVLLDDVADRKNSKKLLDEILKIPLDKEYVFLEKLNKRQKRYFRGTLLLWKYLKRRIRKFPDYKFYKEIFEYDLRQVINAMRYSHLVNRNHQIFNKVECWQFMPYNMVAFIYSGIDLMCSNKITKMEEIGKIREMIFYSQRMARIGNWISTWEREVYEKDFSNVIIVHAIDSKNISVEDLKKGNEEKIIEKVKNSDAEKEIFKKWENYYWEIEKIKRKTQNVNLLDEFLLSLEKLIIFHLSSRNYK